MPLRYISFWHWTIGPAQDDWRRSHPRQQDARDLGPFTADSACAKSSLSTAQSFCCVVGPDVLF
jgi:hypothetical protein